MKNKLHTTVCHAELVTEPSRSAASHHYLSRQRIKLLSFFSILCSLFSVPSYAQTYKWDWAVSGGGPLGDTRDEQIYDIKVGTDNNYYFIATVYGKNGVQLNGQSVKTYNQSISVAGGSPDIFLFSTTCDGTVRWSQAIGGGTHDYAFNLVLDNQNNVYVGANVRNDYITPDGHPVHFSPTDSLQNPDYNNQNHQDDLKTSFLVKYDSNGQFIGKKALQGNDVTFSTYYSHLLELAIDSQNNLHFIVGLMKGTHLDNKVTVPNTVTDYLYFLAKYDSDLNYVSSMQLPVTNGGFPGQGTVGAVKFAYDENLNQYYISGYRHVGGLVPLSYDGSAVENLSFLFAIDGTDGGLLWHRELYAKPVNNQLAFAWMTSLQVDTNSDVYFGGKFSQTIYPPEPVKIYNPNDSINTTYSFIPPVTTNVPIVIKFNSSGTVQWVKTPTAFAPGKQTNHTAIQKGLALKSGEVAFGSSEGNFQWDSFTLNYPYGQGTAPTLLRFDKQTGTTIGMHSIDDPGSNKTMTALAVDRDGNYVTGGHFMDALFSNTPGIAPLNSAGESDFFVAKLGAYACGTNSTEKFNNIKVNVYPNPTNDIINIETDETLLNYVVYDMNGREIQNGIFGSSNQLNLQNATNGVYFVKVTTIHNNVATVRVIKK